ncbi:MAG: HAMP domain-containing histidine kinase [Spirochaetes bacterium]|nr:HAMP domain-containing histidine kinase [Spirochaetota bacterium]
MGRATMKHGKLYLRIYLFFILTFFVALLFIFVLFSAIVSGEEDSRLERYIAAQVYVVQMLLERAVGDSPLAGNEDVSAIVSNLARMYGARVWIEGDGGEVIASSFDKDPPDLSRFRTRETGGHIVYSRHKRTMPVAVGVRFASPSGEKNILFLHFGMPHPGPFQKTFAFGLILIGAVTALLLLPLTRNITKPLERLRRSALKIADGDLGERAEGASNDEIGDLVRSFNVMAERVERMVTGTKRLTANVSHELRSPLARARVAWELLNERITKKEAVSRYLQSIREEIEEMDRLIGTILKLSKLEMRQSGTVTDMDLADVIQTFEKRYKPLMENAGLSYTYEGPGTAVPVRAEKEQLLQAFSNLFDNAVKFTNHGGGIRTGVSVKGDDAVFLMANSAESLREETIKKIFEPFSRGSSPGIPGTGLGLAIAKQAVENTGGTIEAGQADGEFFVRITLPITS